jgi:microcystin-dependent protein
LLCDGAAVSRATYAALYTVLGGASSPWGQGDGTSTFNVPDLRGRVAVGAGQGSALTNRALADRGGEETHVLLVAELASHTHTQNAHNHTQDAHNHTQNAHNHLQDPHSHSIQLKRGDFATQGEYGGVTTLATGVFSVTQPATATNQAATATNNPTAATNQPATAVNQNTGSDSGHNTMPPFAVLNKIIKT